jgi:tetratricopeptide (TPR) repeat protein
MTLPRGRRLRRGLWLILAGALALSGGRASMAQQAPAQASALEQEALRLYSDNHLVTARAKAESVLRVDPDSIVGNYVLGCVLREAEGSLSRAMFHLGRAREVYETRYGSTRVAGAPWQIHRDILFATQALAGEMEEYEYQLHVLEFHDFLYDPDLLAEHAWPLVHLNRLNEARDFAQRAVRTSDPWQQSLGRNALCAVEGAARARQPQYRACLDAFQSAVRRAQGSTDTNPATSPHVTVHAYNAALGALAVLRFDEAERMLIEGTHRLEFTTANPWRLLARLYLDTGRTVQAVDALREMQRWRVRQPANLRDQDRAETDVAVATVLLVAGEGTAGLRFIDRAIERPDRRGLVASDQEQALGAHALLRRALRTLQSELEAEQASASGFTGRVSGSAGSLVTRARAWPDDERVTNALTDELRLDATLRMYVRRGIEPVPTWLVGDLVRVLGPGVVAVALRDARREEAAFPSIRPLHDALEAELRLAQGDQSQALALAERSLAALPSAEVLLQARVAAVAAEAAHALGRDAASYGYYERAMQKDAGTLRRMGLALPAHVRAAGNGAAVERVGALLGRSPRLRSDDRGFEVLVTGTEAALRLCLRSPLATQLTCAEVTRARGEPSEAFAARAVQAFHTGAFATRVGLSTTDVRSLDGTTTANDAAAREQMNGVLHDITGPESSP